MLGLWEESYHDLTTACKLDYDDDANEMLKQVKPNVRHLSLGMKKQQQKKTGL